MATLHTVSRSPYRDGALDACLRTALPGSAVLLIEDGVYAALAAGEAGSSLARLIADLRIYVLGPDLAARGLAEAALVEGLRVVDYEGFVDLACRYQRVQAWN